MCGRVGPGGGPGGGKGQDAFGGDWIYSMPWASLPLARFRFGNGTVMFLFRASLCCGGGVLR